LADLLQLDNAAFRKLFSGSPIKRIGRDRFIRNVAIAAGNSGDNTLRPLLTALLDDPDETIREIALWAIDELIAA
jgi:epoxyqueuosine reductase